MFFFKQGTSKYAEVTAKSSRKALFFKNSIALDAYFVQCAEYLTYNEREIRVVSQIRMSVK
jgi:hypothetical protein